MKLRNLAALIFRFIGLCYIIDGLATASSTAIKNHDLSQAAFDLFEVCFGFCFIYFSQKIARWFCKGLDDDAT